MFIESQPPSARDLRKELLAAAAEMLSEPQQVAVPSLRSIARACSVAPSAVYWHFPSEAVLRSAVLNAQYDDLVSTVAQAVDDGLDAIDGLLRGGLSYVEWGMDHPGAYQLLFEGSDPLTVDRSPSGAAVQDRIVEMVAAINPAPPFGSALLLWAALHGVVSLRLHKPAAGWQTTVAEDAEHTIRAMTAASTVPSATPSRHRKPRPTPQSGI